MKLPLLLAFGILALAADAHAQACRPGDPPNLCVIEPSDVNGDDTAPYCFVPTLPRGQHETLYAVTSVVGPECHSFITYLRFQLPSNLLDPGETVLQVRLIVPYAFGFEYGQGPNTNPHGPVTLRVHRVLSTWTENGVTWLSKPPFVELPTDQITDITAPSTLELDVTSVVRAWAHGSLPNHGFALTTPDSHTMGIYSWESAVPAASRNALWIVTGPGAAPEVPIMPAWIAALLVLGIATVLAIRSKSREAAR